MYFNLTLGEVSLIITLQWFSTVLQYHLRGNKFGTKSMLRLTRAITGLPELAKGSLSSELVSLWQEPEEKTKGCSQTILQANN